MIACSPTLARRLALTRQRLAGPRPAGLMEVARDLGCLQLDPLSVVARSHALVFRSRLGRYDPADLDRLLWEERRLFEYWAHCASIVLTEDYPLHFTLMRRYPPGDSTYGANIRAWVQQNGRLKRYILTELRRRGPLLSRELEEGGQRPTNWVSPAGHRTATSARCSTISGCRARSWLPGARGFKKSGTWLSAACPPGRRAKR